MNDTSIQPPEHPYSETAERSDGFHHVAVVDIPAGVVISKLMGSLRLDHPNMHSIHIGLHEHLEVHAPFRYTQHSCDPNSTIRYNDCKPWELVSTRPIEKGDDITFFYPITEYESAEVFNCCCGAASCVGNMTGYRHLPPEKKKEIEPFISPVIRQLRDQSH